MAIVALVAIIGGVGAGMLFAGGDETPRDPGRQAIATTAIAHDATSVTSTPAAVGDATTPTTAATDPRDPAGWPLHGASARRRSVPILMYHLIAAAPAGTTYPGLWVPPAELAEHVAALGDAGFTGVTLGEVWDAWHGDGHLPRKPVVLSFDDGDLSQVMGAAPILKAAGWPGVLNLATNHVGKGGLPRWGVKRLLAQGWSIDSHTATHTDVTTLDAAGFKRELNGSRATIHQEFGVVPRFFCYPSGRHDPASEAAVKAAGYEAATTVRPGIAERSDDAFTLPRIRVNPGTPGAQLVAQASGEASPPPPTEEG